MRTFNIAGHLAVDPELYTDDEMTWTQLHVVTSDGHSTHQFWITAFEEMAEEAVEKLREGDGIAIRGDLLCTTHKNKEWASMVAHKAQFFPKPR
jgi:single-stranded DNA-binding protein